MSNNTRPTLEDIRIFHLENLLDAYREDVNTRERERERDFFESQEQEQDEKENETKGFEKNRQSFTTPDGRRINYTTYVTPRNREWFTTPDGRDVS